MGTPESVQEGYLSLHLRMHLRLHLKVHLRNHLKKHLKMYKKVTKRIDLMLHLMVLLSVHLSVQLSVPLRVYLKMYTKECTLRSIDVMKGLFFVERKGALKVKTDLQLKLHMSTLLLAHKCAENNSVKDETENSLNVLEGAPKSFLLST